MDCFLDLPGDKLSRESVPCTLNEFQTPQFSVASKTGGKLSFSSGSNQTADSSHSGFSLTKRLYSLLSPLHSLLAFGRSGLVGPPLCGGSAPATPPLLPGRPGFDIRTRCLFEGAQPDHVPPAPSNPRRYRPCTCPLAPQFWNAPIRSVHPVPLSPCSPPSHPAQTLPSDSQQPVACHPENPYQSRKS